MPTDRPRSSAQTCRGASQRFVLPKTLSRSLKTLSHREGVTPFMTLLAAFQTLIHRYTGQSDIAIGSPVAGRKRPELESLIGFFLNMLVLRTDLSGNPTFRQLVACVREVCLSAYEHQDLPFEKLVEELHPERNLTHNPLFQVTFALQNTPKSPLELVGLTTTTVAVDPGIARFDLHLFLEEDENTLTGYLNYNTDLFNPETISRMAAHFQRLLEAIVADPDQRIGELPLLTEAEQNQLLVEWNSTQRLYPNDKSIHQLFEEQAERAPEAVAVDYEDQQLSYRELNGRANRLAHYLKKHGVRPGMVIGVCLERSPETIVALLGILKAGGAYLPLDPAEPEDRLGFMLVDAKVRLVLTQEKFRGQIQHPLMVCLNKDSGEISCHSAENSHGEAAPEDLAYVMYTSGSTGQPKGVEVTHRGVLRLLFGVDYARFDAAQTFLHLAPFSFDASTFEIWGALLHGAKCVLFPGTLPAASELGALLHKYNITSLWLTASLFNTVIDEAPQALSGIAQLLIGGEALSVSHVRRALTLLPHTEIVNGYGPTEGTTFTCCYPIPRQLDDSASSIPIGRPIANTQVYVLDSHLAPVPVGVTGELYIGGDGLARGYLNRPELTADRFIPNPFSHEPGARLYKTADLARYRPDGNIEFLGRIDHQVKIRGFRIEPGEIEAVLCLHPAVREVVVLAHEHSLGERSLIAYVVSAREPPPTTSELRSFLKQKLPDYMIPSTFVFLSSLPLTPNGKVDRGALPLPDHTRRELEQSFVAPGTPVEELLATIWTEVLKLAPVGIHDNFFDLGGHSLLATQVIARVREALHVDLPLRALFEKPTVAELAPIITDHQSGSIVVKDKDLVTLLAELESMPEEQALQSVPTKAGQTNQTERPDCDGEPSSRRAWESEWKT
ncbi:MAG: non-ribosomal peptide synthetase [Candidatus Binatia bacterium]